MSGDYKLVRLTNGEKTLYSASYGEKMHPGLGPRAEADLLYVKQLKICERLPAHQGEFVIWDIGLGAAANAIAVLQAAKDISARLRIVSFDNTDEPLAFALNNAPALGYPVGYEEHLKPLLEEHRAEFASGKLRVEWEFHLGDFPSWLAQSVRVGDLPPAPHAIFYDAFSPAKNPAMWTLPVFENLHSVTDAKRPCGLTTYSRSTLLRVTLLLAGFYVGVGHATGMKEETTIASNVLDLLAEPLDLKWLERARRSDSAEPLIGPVYSKAPISPRTFEKLQQCRQFA